MQLTLGTETRTASAGLGEISEVRLPSDAVIDYHYRNDGSHKLIGTADNSGDSAAADDIAEKTITHDGVTDTWSYSGFSDNSGMVTNPDGSTYVEYSRPVDRLRGYQGAVDGLGGRPHLVVDDGTPLDPPWRIVLGIIRRRTGSGKVDVSYNPVIDTEYTTLLDIDGTTRLAEIAKSFTYDYNGDLLSTTEYDWFDPASVSYDSHGPTGVPSGTAHTLVRNQQQLLQHGIFILVLDGLPGPNSTSGSTLILGKPEESTVGTSSTVKSDTKFSYDGNSWGTAPSVGNLTTTSVYNDTASAWINTTATYDVRQRYGNQGW